MQQALNLATTAFGFNLSILECKLDNEHRITEKEDGFNLSILECKFRAMSARFCIHAVLIYPYWNVNTFGDYLIKPDGVF